MPCSVVEKLLHFNLLFLIFFYLPYHTFGMMVTQQVQVLVRVWDVRVRVQVSKREFHIHIYLNYDRVEFYLILKKKNYI